MGYYTYFDLEIDGDSAYAVEDIKNELESIVGYTYLFEDSHKWYDHEEDMREFSSKYPDLLLVLRGDGEERGDFWRKYFKNGKMLRCKGIMTYEPFDESKMT